MNVPADLRYSSDHEWIRQDGNVVTIGITEYAQDSLGDVVFVEVPEQGMTVVLGDSFTEVESTKSVSDIYAPVSGIHLCCQRGASTISPNSSTVTLTVRVGSAQFSIPTQPNLTN